MSQSKTDTLPTGQRPPLRIARVKYVDDQERVEKDFLSGTTSVRTHSSSDTVKIEETRAGVLVIGPLQTILVPYSSVKTIVYAKE